MANDKIKDRLRRARDASKKQQNSTSWRDAQHTLIPPVRTGYQTEGLMMLPVGKYKMPDGSSQVSLGLPQAALDAYRSMRYGLGAEQDPAAPKGYVSQGQIEKGAWGLSGAATTGNLGLRAVSRFNYLPEKYYHGSSHKFGPRETFDASKSLDGGAKVVVGKSLDRNAMFVTPRRSEAEYFGENVIPLRVRSKKFFDYRRKSHLRQIKDPDLRQQIADGHFVGFSRDEFQDFLREKGYSGWYEHEGKNVASTIYPKEYEKAYKLEGDKFHKKIEELDKKALREVNRRPNIAIIEPNTVYRRNGRRIYSSGVPGLYIDEERNSTAERLKAARKKAKQGS